MPTYPPPGEGAASHASDTAGGRSAGGTVILQEVTSLLASVHVACRLLRRLVDVARGTAAATARLYPLASPSGRAEPQHAANSGRGNSSPRQALHSSSSSSDTDGHGVHIAKPILGRAELARLFDRLTAHHASFTSKLRFLLVVGASFSHSHTAAASMARSSAAAMRSTSFSHSHTAAASMARSSAAAMRSTSFGDGVSRPRAAALNPTGANTVTGDSHGHLPTSSLFTRLDYSGFYRK